MSSHWHELFGLGIPMSEWLISLSQDKSYFSYPTYSLGVKQTLVQILRQPSAVWPKISYLASLDLSFLIFGIQGFWKDRHLERSMLVTYSHPFPPSLMKSSQGNLLGLTLKTAHNLLFILLFTHTFQKSHVTILPSLLSITFSRCVLMRPYQLLKHWNASRLVNSHSKGSWAPPPQAPWPPQPFLWD